MTNNDTISQSHPLSIDRRDYYNALATATPVSLIMTKEVDLVSCELGTPMSEVFEDPRFGDFDFLPVVENESIVGLLTKEGNGEGTVADIFRPLHPAFLLTETSPIFRFIERVDYEPCCLIVGAHGISGMATASDLQKLPVQVALFGLIAQFEHLISEHLRRSLPDKQDKFHSVLGLFDRQTARSLERLFRKNDANNLTLDWVTPLSLGQKLSALRQNAPDLLDWDQAGRIAQLRNDVFHANEFARTFVLIRELVGAKKAMINMIDYLSDALITPDAAPG